MNISYNGIICSLLRNIAFNSVYDEFLKTMDATKLCLYLKMFEIGSDKLSYSVKYDKNLVILMLTLRMIPPAKNPVRDRITSFIRKKCGNVFC